MNSTINISANLILKDSTRSALEAPPEIWQWAFGVTGTTAKSLFTGTRKKAKKAFEKGNSRIRYQYLHQTRPNTGQLADEEEVHKNERKYDILRYMSQSFTRK